jgi:hypothetical protein
MASSSSIAAYTFAADIYAPDCIVDALTKTEAYDGWALGDGIIMSVEENLDEIAGAFQIDRQDENTFDSDEFPKVVFSDQVAEDDSCACGMQLWDH